MSARRVVVGLILGIHGGICLAQALPDSAADLHRQELQLKQLRQRNEALPDIRLEDAPTKVQGRLPEEVPCFPIKSVVFAGASLALSELHQALAGPLRDDPPEGRCLGAQSIRLLLDRAQNALIGQGYITSRVLALPQDIKGGELIFSIDPGRVGQVRQQDPETAVPADFAYLATQPGRSSICVTSNRPWKICAATRMPRPILKSVQVKSRAPATSTSATGWTSLGG